MHVSMFECGCVLIGADEHHDIDTYVYMHVSTFEFGFALNLFILEALHTNETM